MKLPKKPDCCNKCPRKMDVQQSITGRIVAKNLDLVDNEYCSTCGGILDLLGNCTECDG